MTPTHGESVAMNLLLELCGAGISLTAALDVEGDFTEATLARIRQHKPALLRLLVNPYRHVCIENPDRQKVCDLLADAFDRDPLACMALAKRWYEIQAVAGDAAAWAALQSETFSPNPRDQATKPP